MAEGPGKDEVPQGKGDQSDLEALSAGLGSALMSGQSKSTSESFQEFSELEGTGEGKNAKFMVCRFCHCKVLKPGYSAMVERELFLPSMSEKYRIGSEPSGDQVTQFWLVEDMFHFENVGFSKTVNETVKYLICADCEKGPIGWHDVGNRKEYLVAAERVLYSSS